MRKANNLDKGGRGWQEPVGASEGPSEGCCGRKLRASVAADEAGGAGSLQAVGGSLDLTSSAWEATEEF